MDTKSRETVKDQKPAREKIRKDTRQKTHKTENNESAATHGIREPVYTTGLGCTRRGAFC